ncbi:carboxymuconolactone decarboxylase family protein [Novosphingobium aquae]|uniref:Carboxymuconolactone decarboxylase family protein n=1 Tax=Novosphingobium aquae TaxID=3133435 RepID=A0ABU8SCP3_9SPHN
MTDKPKMPMGSQRQPSIAREEWTDEVLDLFGVLEGDWGRENGSKYNYTHWLANHPVLGTKFMQFNLELTTGVFQPRLRELIVLRVSNRFKSEYEWNLHVQISAQYGIGPEQIAAVQVGPSDPLWTEAERLCLRATDALCDKNDIDDDLWAALAAEFDRKELIELLFLVGTYSMLAWILKSVRLPSEDLKAAWH